MGLSFGHLLILAVVILLFGTRRLPELGTAFGKSMRAFREALKGKEIPQADDHKAAHIAGEPIDVECTLVGESQDHDRKTKA